MRGKQSGRVVYMHTIDGRPAQYWPDEQICFPNHRTVDRFAESRQQIYQERRRSEAWRRKEGHGPTRGEYGFVKLRLPGQHLEEQENEHA